MQYGFATLEVLRLEGAVKLTAPDYTIAMSILGIAQMWQQALKLFEAMPQAKVLPDVISFNAGISACEKGGHWQEALKLLEAMPAANVQADVFSYSAAISACGKGGQWQEALKLFEAMPQARVRPNVTTAMHPSTSRKH